MPQNKKTEQGGRQGATKQNRRDKEKARAARRRTRQRLGAAPRRDAHELGAVAPHLVRVAAAVVGAKAAEARRRKQAVDAERRHLAPADRLQVAGHEAARDVAARRERREQALDAGQQLEAEAGARAVRLEVLNHRRVDLWEPRERRLFGDAAAVHQHFGGDERVRAAVVGNHVDVRVEAEAPLERRREGLLVEAVGLLADAVDEGAVDVCARWLRLPVFKRR